LWFTAAYFWVSALWIVATGVNQPPKLIYALSDFLQPTLSANQTTREVLLEAMKGKVLATASLRVVYTR